MLIANLPETLKIQASKGYYSIYGQIFPNIWRFIGGQLQEIAPLLMYVFIVRINKKYCVVTVFFITRTNMFLHNISHEHKNKNKYCGNKRQ